MNRLFWLGILLATILPQTGFSQTPETATIRKIYVPADSPESWPEGDWIPVPSDRLRDPSAEPDAESFSPAWARSAKYEASLQGNSLVRGNLRVEIEHARHSDSQVHQSLLPWTDTTLAVSNLNWESGPAKLGNGEDGTPYLMASPQHKILTGNWTYEGRALSGGAFFTLQFPPSAVTEFLLHIPRRHELKLFDSVPVKELSTESPREQTFQLSLGSRAKVRFFVSFGTADKTHKREPQLFTRAETLVLLARDQSRVRQELLIESLGSPVKSIKLPVPTNLKVRSIEYGGITMNNWNVTRDPPQTLTIQFPEPIEGLGRPLLIDGQLNYEESQLWRVPHLLPQNSHPISETVTLNVTPPHELLTIRPEGFRQTSSSTSTTGAGSLTFQRSSPVADIDVRVGLPPTRLKTDFVSRLNRDEQSVSADVHLTGSVDSGRLYSVWMEIAPQWDPLSIEFLDQSTMRLTPDLPWAIESSNGRRTLRVEFPKAVNREQPLKLTMKFRHRRMTGEAIPQVPVVRMSGEIPSQQALLIRREDFSIDDAQLEADGWQNLTANEVPSWMENAISSLISESNVSEWDMLAANKPAFIELPIFAKDEPLEVNSIDRLRISEKNSKRIIIREELELILESQSSTRESVQFTTASNVDLNQFSWDVFQSPQTRIVCRQVEEPENVRAVHVWELEFDPPLKSSMRVLGTRTQRNGGELHAVLPVIQGEKSSGRLELVTPPHLTDQVLEFLKYGYLEDPPPEKMADTYETLYLSDLSTLSIDLPRRGDSSVPVISDVKLQSELISGASDQFSHRMLIELENPGSEFRIRLPEQISELAAFFNGNPVRVRGLEEGLQSLNLESPAKSLNQLELTWRSSVIRKSNGLWGEIPLPQLLLPSDGLQWHLNIPEDCRVEDYAEPFLLQSSQVERHWTQRYFGPLGRTNSRELFHPLRAEEWRGLLQAEPEPDGAEQQVLIFESRQFPETIRVKIWSESRHRALAWVVFCATLLCGVAVRITRWEGRLTLVAWSLTLTLIACTVVPDSWVTYSGAINAGLIVAMLFPRMLLLGRRKLTSYTGDESQITEASTLKRVTVGLLLSMTVFHSTNSLLGQSESRRTAPRSEADQRREEPGVVDLLIPYSGETPNETLPELIYVRDAQRQSSIFSPVTKSRPVLITSADYECRLNPQGPASFKILLTVEVPEEPALDYFTLPLQGANLARENGCLVEGHPTSVAMTANGVLEVPIPPSSTSQSSGEWTPLRAPRPDRNNSATPRREKYRSLVVELNLYASVDIQNSVRQFQLAIPPVSNSRMRCRFPEEFMIEEFGGARGAITERTKSTLGADLGNTSTLNLKWHFRQPETPLEDTPQEPKITLSPQYYVEAFSTHLNYRIRVSHSVEAGSLSTIRWELPVQFHFRKVLSQPVLQTRDYLADGKRVVLFDLLEELNPSRSPFVINAEFVVPISKQEEDEVVVDVPQLQQTDEGGATFTLLEESMASLGLWSPPDLPLTLLEFPLEGLKNLSADAYLSRWPQGSGLQTPQHAFELRGPLTLSFLRTESKPQKKVWVKETGVISDQFLEWEWSGEVQTTELPAFEHEFLIDPRLEILSVSVKEDQAERVNRWSRDGNRLTVRLTRKAEESSQDVRIQARMELGLKENATRHEEEVELPEIRLLTGERMEAIAELFVVPTRTIRWKNGRVPTGGSTEVSSASRSETLSSFDLFSRLEGSPAEQTIIVGEKTIPPHIHRLIQFEKRADDDFDVVCRLTDHQPENVLGALELIVPETWIPRLRVERDEESDAEISRELNENGTLTLTIPEKLRGTTLVLRTTLAASDQKTWLVSWPEASSEAVYQNEVSLKLADGWAPRMECRLEEEGTPPLKNEGAHFDRWEYLCDQLELQKTEVSDPSAVPFIPLLVSRVDIRPGKVIQGEYGIIYRGRGREQIELTLPFPALVHSVRRAGEIVESDWDEEHRLLKLPLTQDAGWQFFAIDWSSTDPFTPGMLSEMNLPFPAISEIEVGQQQVTLLSSSDLKLMMYHGVQPQSRAEYRLTLLETLTRQLKEDRVDVLKLPQDIQTLFVSLIQDELANDSFSNDKFRNKQALLNRYEKARSDFLSQMPEEILERAAEAPAKMASTSVGTLMAFDAESDLPGQTVLYAVAEQEPESSKVWWLVRLWYLLGICVVAAAVMIPLFCWGLRESTANWIAQNRVYLWMFIGLLWWTCLQLSFVGLVILALALISRLISPFTSRRRVY
ncbi:MAG: hypothetical protein HUJ26_09580 [Planctomycetaceae bacterium]|nr:hypothetical protein [Planctomycetaceae bacterium]